MKSRLTGSHALLLSVLAVACGSDDLTGPSSASFSGRWSGTFTVTSCTATGEWGGCGDLSPGAARRAVLVLTEEGVTVSGFAFYGDIDPGRTSRFTATLGPERSLEMSTEFGMSPTVIATLSWKLRPDSPGRLRGTLAVSRTWYRLPGAAVSEGEVDVTREENSATF